MKTGRWTLTVALALMVVAGLEARQDRTLTEAEIQELVRQSADKEIENTRRQRNYTYVQRTEQRRKDNSGGVRSVESKTWEILVLSGEPARKLIAKDDRDLSPKEARKEEDRIQRLIEKYGREDAGQRRRRVQKSEKATDEDRQFVREIADAYHFRFVGNETLDGRSVYVVDADPVPGYKPRHKDADILPKFKFRAWVDVAERQWVKLDVQSIDTVSFGWFLARIGKGSRILLEQTRVNDEVWLPKRGVVTLDARIALLKKLNLEFDVTFRDYRKFVATTEVRPLGEAPTP